MKKIKYWLFALLLLPLGIFLAACGETQQSLDITTTEDFIVEGNTISTKVSNSTENILLYEKVSVEKDISWKLYTDIEGQNEIVTKSVSLEVGNNKFYIIVADKNGNIKLYNVNIRRRPMYNVSFDTNGGGEIDSQAIEEDNVATIPEVVPIKGGYTFDSWNFDFSQKITCDTTIFAHYIANKYTITYKLNNGDDDVQQEVSYAEMVRLRNSRNTLRDGYQFEYWIYTYDSEDFQVTGQTMFRWEFPCNMTFNAVWSLQTYSIGYELNGGRFINEDDVITTYTIESETYGIPKPYKQGLSFGGWYDNADFNGESIETISAGSFGNVSLFAKWCVVDAAYQDYRDSNEDVVALCERADNGEPISNFSAVEVFEIAEYKLLHSDKYYSVICGTQVPLIGGSQYQSKEILWRDGNILINKLSPGSVVVGIDTNIHTQTIYLTEEDIVTVNKDGVFLTQKTYGNAWDMADDEIIPMDGLFNLSSAVSYTLEEYFDAYFRTPLSTIPYIISSITCAQGGYTTPTVNADGTYTFEINLSNDYLYAAAIYYSKEIEQDSGTAPIWNSVNIKVTVDSHFCFKKIVYTENYRVNRTGIIVSVSKDLVQKFEYDNLPTIEGLQHLDEYVRYSDINLDDLYVYDASEYDKNEGYIDASYKLATRMNPSGVVVYAVGCEKDTKGFKIYRNISTPDSNVILSDSSYCDKNLVFNYESYENLLGNNYLLRKKVGTINSETAMVDYLKNNNYLIVVDNANYERLYYCLRDGGYTFDSSVTDVLTAFDWFKTENAQNAGFVFIDMDKTFGAPITNNNGTGFGQYYVSYGLKKNYDNREFVKTLSLYISRFVDDIEPNISVDNEHYSCDNSVVTFDAGVSDNRDYRLHLEAMYRLLTGAKEVIVVDGLQSSYILGIKEDLNASQLLNYSAFFEVPSESEMSGYVKLLANNGVYSLNLDEFVEGAEYLQVVLYAYDDSGNVGVIAKEIEISYYLSLLYMTPIMQISGINSCTRQIGAEIELPTPKVKFEYKDSVCYSEMEQSTKQNVILGLEKDNNGEYVATNWSTNLGTSSSFITTEVGEYDLEFQAIIRVYNRTKFEYHETSFDVVNSNVVLEHFTRIGYNDILIYFIDSNEIKLERNENVYSVYLEDGNIFIENGADAVFGITKEDLAQWFDDFDYFTLTSDTYIITVIDTIGPETTDYCYATTMSVEEFETNGITIFAIEATDASGINAEKSKIVLSWRLANGTTGCRTWEGIDAFVDNTYNRPTTMQTVKFDGAYTITYTVYDNNGNYTTKEYTIYVGDTTEPIISFDNDFVETSYMLGSILSVDITKIHITDDGGMPYGYIPTITLINTSMGEEVSWVQKGNCIVFDEFDNVGIYTLKIEASDIVGNVATETFSIEVSRNTN